MHWVYAAETHEAFHWESGMRYQIRHFEPVHTRIRSHTKPANGWRTAISEYQSGRMRA
jgi:hypothetical protein